MAFTFFFRDHHTLQQAVSILLTKVESLSKIKIWDAGCAHGPEPYTFAIILSEKLGYFGFKKVRIDATDIDETNNFGKTIQSGIYPYEELKRIPEDIFKKYFEASQEDGYFRISENIKSRVHFQKHDLLSLSAVDSDYNLIINKNVLLHFSPEQRIEVIKMYHRSLATNGLLVTEQTQPIPDEISHLFEKVVPDANVFLKK